jgi:hypothetical protein
VYLLKIAHNIYVTRIYVEYQTKKFQSEFGRIVFKLCIIIIVKNDINDNPSYFLMLLKFEKSL